MRDGKELAVVSAKIQAFFEAEFVDQTSDDYAGWMSRRNILD